MHTKASFSCWFCVRSGCTVWSSWFLGSGSHRYHHGLASFLEVVVDNAYPLWLLLCFCFLLQG